LNLLDAGVASNEQSIWPDKYHLQAATSKGSPEWLRCYLALISFYDLVRYRETLVVLHAQRMVGGKRIRLKQVRAQIG
jgi:hypothetical protein